MNYIFKTNTDDALRQKIMGINATYDYGGITKFEKMTRKTFQELYDNGFIDVEDCYNSSPTHGEYKELLHQYPEETIYLHGYIVSPERDDFRLTIEGVEAQSKNKEFLKAFKSLFGDADSFVCKNGEQYCWYD